MSDELTDREDRRGGGNPLGRGSRVGTEREGHRGQLPHVPTDESRRQVLELAKLQVSQMEIAEVMGVSHDTIHRHYNDEFTRGRAEQGMRLRRHAYDQAYGMLVDPDDVTKGYKAEFKPDPKMTQFLLERQFGMVQQTRQEHVGDPERPVEIRAIRRMIVDPKQDGE